MNELPVGLSTGCFYHRNILEVLPLIREGGFTLIEICSSAQHLDYHDTEKVKAASKLIGSLGMEPFSFHAPFADWIDITSFDRDRRERSVLEMLKAAEAAAELGVLNFVIHPGPERVGKPPAEEYLQHLGHAAAALTRVAKRCRELGMALVVENMLPHLLFGRTSDLLWIIGAIDETNFGTCLDTGHAYLSGDLYTVMYKLSGHLLMIHLSDNNGSYDNHFTPGKGRIEWRVFLGKLLNAGFAGTFILELAGEPARPPHEILTDARDGRNLVRETCRAIALEKPV